MNTQPQRQRGHRLIRVTVAFALAILLRLSIPAYSQRFMFGGKIAGQITNTFTYPDLPPVIHEDRLLFGPMAEVRLTHGTSVELDAIYKRKLDYSSTFGSYQPFSPTGTIDVTNHSWELPLILKWRVPVYRAPIFVGYNRGTQPRWYRGCRGTPVTPEGPWCGPRLELVDLLRSLGWPRRLHRAAVGRKG
jgi:hypothetical protein